MFLDSRTQKIVKIYRTQIDELNLTHRLKWNLGQFVIFDKKNQEKNPKFYMFECSARTYILPLSLV